MVIYKNYDQAALDRQYNNRTQVPDFAHIVAQWEEASEALRQQAYLCPNLAYGNHERERLDIFPALTPNAPVLVFFHGGYWQAMDKAVFHFVARGFIEHNVTVVLVNYPLAPAASMDIIVDSCRQAMRWLYTNISDYNGSPSKIYISGHSAGGHLVAMLLASSWPELGAAPPDDPIKGGCAISGLFNLMPIRLSYLNQILGLDQSAAQRNSPIVLRPNGGGTLIVAVGSLESDEYHAQSQELLQAWSQADLSLTYQPIGGANHFSILEHLADPEKALSQAILKLMAVELNAPIPDS